MPYKRKGIYWFRWMLDATDDDAVDELLAPGMTDREGESMSTNESITKELRALIEEHWPHSNPTYREGEMKFAPGLDGIADRIDERFSRELTAKQDEVDALLSKLDASIPLPLDADGEPWTGEDVDKPFLFAEDAECKTLREIAITWWGRSWCLVDDYDTHYPADRCHHVAPEPPDTIECVRGAVDRGYFWCDGERIEVSK